MGVILSTTTYPPFALVTGIIGIISFIFTLFTLLKVTFVNIETMFEAPHQVHTYLTNLRTELLEERASIRLMRKRKKRFTGRNSANLVGIELDDVTLKTTADLLRTLCRSFKDLERPFLEDGEDGIMDWKDHRRRARGRRDSENGDYDSPPAEKEKTRHRTSSRYNDQKDRDDQEERERDDDIFWAQRTQYAKLDFKRRLIWLRKKSQAQSLSESLSKVQIRRIARQVGGISVLLHERDNADEERWEMMRRMEERMNRIVGVRRVD